MSPAQFDPDAWMKEKENQAQKPAFDPDAFMTGGRPGLPGSPIGPQIPAGAPGSAPTQQQTDQAFGKMGARALEYAPAIFGTIGGILAPELLPAAVPGLLAGVGGAGVGGALGSGVKQTFGQHPANLPEGLKTAGRDAAEQAAAELGGRFVAKPLEWIGSAISPERLYQSALRPSTRLAPDEVKALVKTGLSEKIPVSGAGYQKAVSATDQLNQQIADMIQQKSDMLGAVINPESAASRIEEVRPTFQKQVNPETDLTALEQAKQEFLRQHTTYAPYTKIRPSVEEGAGFIPVGEGQTPIIQSLMPAEAQEIKKGTYVQLRKKYGEIGSASVEAQKSLARGLKEDLVKMFPDLAKLNAKDSALINLEQELAKHAV